MVHDQEGSANAQPVPGPEPKTERIASVQPEVPKGGKAQRQRSRRCRFLRWAYRHHAFLSSLTGGLSAFAALVGVLIALITAYSQYLTNKSVQDQIKQESKASKVQLEQFRSTRETDLVKIVMDDVASPALKSYALKELINVRDSFFGKTFLQREEAEASWKVAANNEDASIRKKELIEAARWMCEESYDIGGGARETIRRMLDLRNANLSFVDISNENIYCADMSGANLDGARLNNTQFSNVILDNVRFGNSELENTVFYWSVIDIADINAQFEDVIENLNSAPGEYKAISCVKSGRSQNASDPVGLNGVCQ